MKRITCVLFFLTILQISFNTNLLLAKGEETDTEVATIIYHITDDSKSPYICIANKAEHLWVGDTFRFTIVANKSPKADIVWSVSNTKVASIERLTGELTLKKAGTVKVYAKDLVTGKGSVCTVEVLDESLLELPELPSEWYETESYFDYDYGNGSEKTVKLIFKAEYKELMQACTRIAFPDEVNGKKISALDENYNEYFINLKSVKYPKYTKRLHYHEYVAYPIDMSGVEEAVLPEYLWILLNMKGNRLKLFHIPKKTREIIDDAFDEFYNLYELIIPEGVNTIRDYEASVESGYLWRGNNAGNIHVDGNNKIFCSIYGVLYNSYDLNDTKEVYSMRRYPSGSNKTIYVAPENTIGVNPSAFLEAKNLKKVKLSDSNGLTYIANKAFKGCSNLVSIVLPSSLQIIGQEAFAGCKKLTNVVIPDGVTEIGAYCFANCPNLNTLTIPASVTKIGVRLVGLTYKDKITIITPKGSYAEQYAKKNGIPYRNK